MQSDAEEIYVTVFAKQTTLISQLERFGFTFAGVNANGENVYITEIVGERVQFLDPVGSEHRKQVSIEFEA